MANVVNKIKIQIPAGKATPAPPVGTALGPAGINLQDFCTKFNDATRERWEIFYQLKFQFMRIEVLIS